MRLLSFSIRTAGINPLLLFLTSTAIFLFFGCASTQETDSDSAAGEDPSAEIAVEESTSAELSQSEPENGEIQTTAEVEDTAAPEQIQTEVVAEDPSSADNDDQEQLAPAVEPDLEDAAEADGSIVEKHPEETTPEEQEDTPQETAESAGAAVATDATVLPAAETDQQPTISDEDRDQDQNS